MRSAIVRLALPLVLAFRLSPAGAQSFDSGSTGTEDLVIQSNTVLPLPANGVLEYRSVTVAQGAVLSFGMNPLNTPVHLLSRGDVIVDGTIDVSGKAPTQGFHGGDPGPGGYAGGSAAYLDLTGTGLSGGGPGLGPGGGASSPGGGNRFGVQGSYNYGYAHLIPMVGGSGGGGCPAGIQGAPWGGGGGGGALLIAANTRIRLGSTGSILARGGAGAAGGLGGLAYSGGSGSGGAIRLIAPSVEGSGTVDVTPTGNPGRLRIDSLLAPDPNLKLLTGSSRGPSFGQTMIVFAANSPRLDLVEVAGTAVPEGTGSSVTIQLPAGSSPSQTVRVQGRSFSASVPIRVAVIPENGSASTFDTTLDNSQANPATVTVAVTLPVNQVARIQVWTR